MTDALTLPAAFPPMLQAETFCDTERVRADVARLAQALLEQGIEREDRVAFALPLSLHAVQLFWAILEVGAVACPINPKLPELQRDEMVRRINAKLLPESFAMTDSAKPVVTRESDPSSWATIIFTSGSSGAPKAAVHSIANHVTSAEAANRNIPLSPGDGWLLTLPLFHVAGIGVLFRCRMAGATVVIPDDDAPLIDAVRQRGVTHLSLVSTQLYRLLQEPDLRLPSLKGILLGGSAIPRRLLEEGHRLGLPLITSYGMTETSTQIAATCPGDALDRLLTSGKPLRKDAIEIRPNGAIRVSGPTLFQGYLQEDGSMRTPFDAEGGFVTGDLGRIDDDGYLHITGRKDNQFISGGENIQPEEIERALCAISGIVEAVVVPIDDAEFGHRPVAFVRTESNDRVRADDIVSQLRVTLPTYKIPVRIHPWPEQDETKLKADRQSLMAIAQRAE